MQRLMKMETCRSLTGHLVSGRGYVSRRLLSLLSPLVILLAGCGGGGVPLSKVTGTVRLDGQPLKEALVKFIPVAGGRTALGNTDSDGKYEMRYTASSNGSPVGKVKVEITTAMEYQDEHGRTQHRPELLPDRYHQKTELVVDVTRSPNKLDFDLKSE